MAKRRAAPGMTPFRIGPVRRLMDAVAPDATGPDMVAEAVNCVLVQRDTAPRLQGRPGLSLEGTQLGGVGARTGQLLIEYTKISGTTYSVAIVGGKFYTYNWGTTTWSEAVNAATFSAASITLSASARCYGVVFNDVLVVSDGTNTPFTWDGTTNGGLTKLTNAPVFYGQPVVYYGKLFGIKSTERSTIVWSEEGDATTGYEAGGYNNAWTLGQTGSSPLEALGATNSALTVIRRLGVTQITGAVSDQFSTTGVQDAVSEQIGTESPAAVVVWDSAVYFLGNDRHLYRVAAGQLEEVGVGHRATLQAMPSTNSKLALVQGALWYGAPDQRFLLWGIPQTGESVLSRYVVLSPDGQSAGTWEGWRGDRLGNLLDGDGDPVLAWTGGTNAAAGADGYAYSLANLDDGVWTDTFNAGAVAISHTVVTGHVGWDEATDKLFDRLDVSLILPTDVTSLTLNSITPRGSGRTLTVPQVAGIEGAKWDLVDWDEFTWAGSAQVEQKVSLGLNTQGRWWQGSVGHATQGEQFVFQSAVLYAQPLDVNPLVT